MKKLIIILVLMSLMCAGAETEAFRSLCIGVANYDDGRVRTGGHNSTMGVYDAFSFAHPGGRNTVVFDPTENELLSAIAREFEDAPEDGLCVLYINSHGGAQGGLSWIEARDGGWITAVELKNALDSVNGKVLLIIDCCNSGGFIGAGAYPDVFSSGVLRSFGTEQSGVNIFNSSKYLTITSCSFDQNSYRIANYTVDEANMSTVFSRALCEALGWDITKDRPTTFKSDIDGDRQVSFSEICTYTRQHCMYYLSFSSPARQTVQYAPETSAMIIASRKR